MPHRHWRDRRHKKPGRPGPHGARRGQRAAEKAMRAAEFLGMIYRTRWPSRGLGSREGFVEGPRTFREVGPGDSFISPDHGSFLSHPEGPQMPGPVLRYEEDEEPEP